VIIYEDVDPQARVDQGDVFKDIYLPAIEAHATAIVVTPTCDLERDKADFVKFISTVELDFVIRIIADSIGIGESAFASGDVITKGQYRSLVKLLRKNIAGDFLPRYYLLPEYPSFLSALYLDFQRVFVVPFQQVIQEYLNNRVTRVASPWREQIAARYTGYSMRVGTPEYSDDELHAILDTTSLTLPE
jgi:hypothetical protein